MSTPATAQTVPNGAKPEYTRVAVQAADNFTEAYYAALSGARGTISSFYLPATAGAGGRALPLITYNGTQISDPDTMQTIYQDQMPFTYFDVQSVNVHVVNPAVIPNPDTKNTKQIEDSISLMVQVSGYVRLVERKEGPMRGFSDTLVLIPNKEELGGKGKAKSGEGRKWVIQTQNFRFVV